MWTDVVPEAFAADMEGAFRQLRRQHALGDALLDRRRAGRRFEKRGRTGGGGREAGEPAE